MRFFTSLTTKKRIFNVAVIVLIIVCAIGFFSNSGGVLKIIVRSEQNSCDSLYPTHSHIVDKYYEKRKYWITSNLGAILFKNVDREIFKHVRRQNKTYTVLIWKHWEWLQNRHLYSYKKTMRSCPGHIGVDCKVISKYLFYLALENSSCRQYFTEKLFHNAYHNGAIPVIMGPPLEDCEKLLPPNSFLHVEDYDTQEDLAKHMQQIHQNTSMLLHYHEWRNNFKIENEHGFLGSKSYHLCRLCEALNYNDGEKGNYNKDDLRLFLDAHLICRVPKKYSSWEDMILFRLGVCPGHFKADCPGMNKYLFYLVLENSSCRQYMTEKLFHHAYSKGAIPVIRGPPLEDCEKLLPPHSYLHIDNYDSLENLTNHIKQIGRNEMSLLAFHQWRNHFDIENEHGYFGSKSYHTCRICEALNYNDGEVSIYDLENLEMFLNENVTCTEPTTFAENKTRT